LGPFGAEARRGASPNRRPVAETGDFEIERRQTCEASPAFIHIYVERHERQAGKQVPAGVGRQQDTAVLTPEQCDVAIGMTRSVDYPEVSGQLLAVVDLLLDLRPFHLRLASAHRGDEQERNDARTGLKAPP